MATYSSTDFVLHSQQNSKAFQKCLSPEYSSDIKFNECAHGVLLEEVHKAGDDLTRKVQEYFRALRKQYNHKNLDSFFNKLHSFKPQSSKDLFSIGTTNTHYAKTIKEEMENHGLSAINTQNAKIIFEVFSLTFLQLHKGIRNIAKSEFVPLQFLQIADEIILNLFNNISDSKTGRPPRGKVKKDIQQLAEKARNAFLFEIPDKRIRNSFSFNKFTNVRLKNDVELEQETIKHIILFLSLAYRANELEAFIEAKKQEIIELSRKSLKMWQEFNPAPAAQPYGVDPQGAELWVKDWCIHMGLEDARVTNFTADGGIDIESKSHIAQVKHYTGNVGISAIREMVGVSAMDGRKGLFFTSGSYPESSIEISNKAHLGLFIYNVKTGIVFAYNKVAHDILLKGFLY